MILYDIEIAPNYTTNVHNVTDTTQLITTLSLTTSNIKHSLQINEHCIPATKA